MFFDQISRRPHHLSIQDRLPFSVVERRNWHTPASLARDAPIRTGRDRAFDPVLSPFRNPLDSINLLENSLPEILMVDPDEPLIHGAEDDGNLAAPAIRIAVLIILLVQQSLARAQFVE